MSRPAVGRGKRDTGFSLVEVLVCVAIASTALVVIVSAARREALAGRAVAREREARAALEEAVDAFQFSGASPEDSVWTRGVGQYRVSWTRIADADEANAQVLALPEGNGSVDSSTVAPRPWVERRTFRVVWTERGGEHSLSREAWKYSSASRPRRKRTRWACRRARLHPKPGTVLIEVLLSLALGSLLLVTVHMAFRRVTALRSSMHRSASRGEVHFLRDLFGADLARARTILATNPGHGFRSSSLTLVLAGSSNDGDPLRRAVWEMDGEQSWLIRKEVRGDGDHLSKVLPASSVWFEILPREGDTESLAGTIRVCVEGEKAGGTEEASAETLSFFLPIPLPVRSSDRLEP